MATAQITHETRPASTIDATPTHHAWEITGASGQVIAELHVATATGEILWIWTSEDHRDHGHATALYRQAASEITIYHAPAAHRTDDGDRFAARVGGPELTCTCCDDLQEN